MSYFHIQSEINMNTDILKLKMCLNKCSQCKKCTTIKILEILHPNLDFKGLVLEIKHNLINNDVIISSMSFAFYID